MSGKRTGHGWEQGNGHRDSRGGISYSMEIERGGRGAEKKTDKEARGVWAWELQWNI
jgi:hypothetical protein